MAPTTEAVPTYRIDRCICTKFQGSYTYFEDWFIPQPGERVAIPIPAGETHTFYEIRGAWSPSGDPIHNLLYDQIPDSYNLDWIRDDMITTTGDGKNQWERSGSEYAPIGKMRPTDGSYYGPDDWIPLSVRIMQVSQTNPAVVTVSFIDAPLFRGVPSVLITGTGNPILDDQSFLITPINISGNGDGLIQLDQCDNSSGPPVTTGLISVP